MPALNFSVFIDKVENGTKRQTIRAYRKDGRDPKPGDTLYLYTGMRRPECRKIGEATCIAALPVRLVVDRYYAWTIEGGTEIGLGTRTAFALADGFENWPAMRDWFQRQHGFPFSGLLIRWGDLNP